MTKFTREQIFNTLKKINGAAFIGIKATVPVKLKGGKKNPMQGKIYKRIHNGNCIIFQNKNINGYDKMVKRRLIKEGKLPDNFKLSPRVWGKRIPNTPFIEHKGKKYLEVIFNQPPKVSYFYNGKPIKKEDIIGLPTPKKGGKQGGLSEKNKVVIRTFNLDNIDEIRFNKDIIS